jgi:hypothetical protein
VDAPASSLARRWRTGTAERGAATQHGSSWADDGGVRSGTTRPVQLGVALLFRLDGNHAVVLVHGGFVHAAAPPVAASSVQSSRLTLHIMIGGPSPFEAYSTSLGGRRFD